MPILHGFSYSNYYNMPKHALLYKGVSFEEDLVYPSAPGYSKLNPALKVPSFTTDQGQHLAEAAVICEFIEETYPQRPLFPTDTYERNRVRQLMHMAELYLELPNRRLLPFGFSGTAAPEPLVEEVKAVVERGINSLNALASFNPWVAGTDYSLADIYLFYVLAVADMGTATTGIDLNEHIPALASWRERFAADEVAQKVAADMHANKESFYNYIRG